MNARPSDSSPNFVNPPLLAQVPDLEAVQPAEKAGPSPSRSDGRIISQALSIKFAVGGGIVVVLAAILPFIFNRKSESKSNAAPASTQSAAPWRGNLAQSPNGQTAVLDGATSPESGSSNETNRPAPAYLQPQAGANRPMALGGPSDGRLSDRSAAPTNYQSDLRSDPAAEYRTARAGRTDYRSDYPAARAPQGNPLMPSPEAVVSPDAQPVEPGMALGRHH